MTRVAILIDGDNVPCGHADRIVSLGQDEGRADVRRVYTDATRQTGWTRVPGVRVKHAGTGKNAADLLLSIDAMDLALSTDVAAFLIASSDGDFAHLATRLREGGHNVIGCGEAKAPEMFRAACCRFEELAPLPTVSCRPTVAGVSERDRRIHDVIKRNSKNGSGIRLAELNARMRAQEHDFKVTALPGGNWRAYLTARPTLFELDPRGPEARVRFIPSGFRG